MTTNLPITSSRWCSKLNRRLLTIRPFLARTASICRQFGSTAAQLQSKPSDNDLTRRRPGPIPSKDRFVRNMDNYLHKRIPQTLFMYRVGTKTILHYMEVANPNHEYTQRDSRHHIIPAYEVDGLVHPYRMGPDKTIALNPHGLRLQPPDSFFYKRLTRRLETLYETKSAANGQPHPMVVQKIPGDTLIPDGLELVQENFYRYFLQCDRPMPGQELKQRLEAFTAEHGIEMSPEEFQEKYPPPSQRKEPTGIPGFRKVP